MSMYAIDPAAVIIGGAMTFGRNETETGRKFLARITDRCKKLSLPVMAEHLAVRFASLGGDAGYIGAAARARYAYLQKESASS